MSNTATTTDTETSEAETPEAVDATPAVDAYLASLTEPDPEARAELVRRAWTEKGHFVDPLLEAQGHQALGDLALVVLEQFPGHSFRRTSGVDGHHSLIRFGWALATGDGSVVLDGLDVGIVADDGRLTNIAGFFGDLPARDTAA